MNHSRRRDKLEQDEKPKSKKGTTKPNYSINGRTYACESCKIGHRVSKCTHARNRPVLMTNDPGRPSADQKRHCDCPRQCSCSAKCKCDRNCSCTQVRYMLVYVPFSNQYGEEEEERGEWKVDREIITDMKGNTLSQEEVQRRAKQRESQGGSRNTRSNILGLGQSSSPASRREHTSTSSAQSDLNGVSAAAPTESCCSHRKNMQPMATAQMESKKEKESSPASTRPKCNCGEGCICAFCLEHPNNKESHRMIQQQAAQFAQNTSTSHPQTTSMKSENGYESCMGTSPQFALHTGPDPSMNDLQNMFGDRAGQGYLIRYPVRPYSPVPNTDEGEARSNGPPLPQPARRDQPTQQSEPPLPKVANNLNALSSPTAATFGDYLGPDALFSMPMSSNQEYLTSNMNSPNAFTDTYVGQGTIAGVFDTGGDWSMHGGMSGVQQTPNWSSTGGMSGYGYGAHTNGIGSETLQQNLGPPTAMSAGGNFTSSMGGFDFGTQSQASDFFDESNAQTTYEWPVANPNGIYQNHHQPNLFGPSPVASNRVPDSVVQPNLIYTNGVTGNTQSTRRPGTSHDSLGSGSSRGSF